MSAGAANVALSETGDPCIAFLVVRPPRSGDVDTVRAYLYGHSYLLEEVSRGYGPVVIVAVVVAPTRDVDYLAGYQSDRLRSGGMRVQVCATWTQAWNHAFAAADTE